MSNQSQGGWEGHGGWGRHGGHHVKNHGHHGGGRHGYHGYRQRREFEEGPLPEGFSEPRRHYGHHGWHRRHRQGQDKMNGPPMWSNNQTGYSWDYDYNTPPNEDKKILEKPVQNSQLKIEEPYKNELSFETKNSEILMKKQANGHKQPPSYIVCPIAQTVMESPVLLATCGHTFDQKAIRDWFKRSKNCPICKSESNQSQIIKNFSLVEAIDRYRSGI